MITDDLPKLVRWIAFFQDELMGCHRDVPSSVFQF
jgi:hypothetical protein